MSVDRHPAIFGGGIAVRYRPCVNAASATEDAKQREQHQPVTTDSEGSHRCPLFQSYLRVELAKLLGIVGGEEGKVK